jgi:hypothetical protein
MVGKRIADCSKAHNNGLQQTAASPLRVCARLGSNRFGKMPDIRINADCHFASLRGNRLYGALGGNQTKRND